MFVKYENYKGGINNLCVVYDERGFIGTSTKGKEQAIKNYKKQIKKFNENKLDIKFVCIDEWNRPIFKAVEKQVYLSDVDNLFDYGTTEKQIKEFYEGKDLHENLTIHGSVIDCDPLGTRVSKKFYINIV